jgi:hypothetical protein
MKAMLSLDELESLIAQGAHAIFNGDIDGRLKELRIASHPDLHPNDRERAEKIFASFGTLADEARKPPTRIKSPKREYTLDKLLATGDISDVYLATGDGKRYVLKASRITNGVAFLMHEKDVIADILKAADDLTYRKYYPTLSESFTVKDGAIRKQINVYVYEPGFYTLSQVHEQHPKLESRHLAWIYKRLLTAIGFAHQQGYVHGSILPTHVQIHAENHGLQLLGWPHSVKIGEKLTLASAAYLSWYPREARRKEPVTPATDICMATKLIIFMAGGNPVTHQIPSEVPEPMRRFWNSCLLESPRMRPDDAHVLHEDFAQVLRQIFGEPRYVPLIMKG